MSCLEQNKKNTSDVVNSGFLLPTTDKMKYISSLAKNDLNDFFELIQHFEARMSVFKDESSANPKYTVTEVTNDKASSDLQIIDELDRLYAIDGKKAFHSESDKHKIATTATVNAIIESIPFVNEIPRTVNLHRQKYTYNSNLPVTKTRQLLYSIYVTNGIVPSTDNLKTTILNKLNSNSLSENDNRILVSVYNYVFSESDLEYKGPQGTHLLKSLQSTSKQSQNQEIRSRAANYTRMFHTAIVAVNNFSSLMIVSEEGNSSRTEDDTLLFRMTSVNAPQINNLFDTLEIVDNVDPKNDLVDVQIKESVAKSFIANNIGVYDISDGTTTSNYATFTYTTKDKKLVPILIPFKVTTNKDSIVDVNSVYNSNVKRIKDKLIKENYSPEEAEKRAEKETKDTLLNPDIIQFILNELGYKGVVNKKVINNILKSSYVDPESNKRAVDTNLDSLYKLIASGIVSVSANLELDKKRKDYKHNFFNTSSKLVSNILETIRKAFRFVPFDRDPNNNNKAFQSSSLVEEGLDVKEFNSSIISPTGFWKNNQWLARQIMNASNIYRKASQYNGDGENVDTNNIASRAELINKYISDIQRFISTGGESAFKTNPFVRERTAKIDKVVRLDSYKDTKADTGKSHMSMNTTEVHRVHTAAFVNNLLDSYDFERNVSPTALVIPQTYSDKSFWGGYVTRFENHDFFPIKNKRLDLETLLKKEVINQRAQDLSFTESFINEWNKMYTTDPDSGLSFPLLNTKIDPSILLSGDSVAFTALLNSIEEVAKFKPDSPISATEFKYYNVDKSKVKTEGYVQLRIAPALREKLLRVFQSDLQYKATTLANLAIDHSLIIKNNSGLNINNQFNSAINQRLSKVLGDDIYLGKDTKLDLSELLSFDVNGFPQVNSIGTFVFNPNLSDSILNELLVQIQDIHPVELSMFFAHNYTSNHLNELLLGTPYQYKNGSEDGMLSDMLKRSVSAASPGIPLSLDTNTIPEIDDLRLPLMSNTLNITENEEYSQILGTGRVEGVEPFDGGSMTTPLYEIMCQESMGGVQGLMPNSSIKFFYAHTNIQNKDTNLIKYALHVITEEMLNIGSPKMWDFIRLQLGTMSINKTVVLPDVIVNGEVIVPARTFTPNNTMFDIFTHIKTNKDLKIPSFDSYKILSDVVRANPELKNRFVHQLILPSSNKTGKSMYHNPDKVLARLNRGETLNDYEFRQLNNSDLTLQLDATHDPENGTVSKYSQGITNAIQEGRTYDEANLLLEKLAQLVETNLEEVRNIFGKTDENGVFVPLGNFNFANGDFSISSFKLEDVKEFSHLEGQPDIEYIKVFENLIPERRVELFIRSTVMDSMEQQDNINSTYKEISSDNFSMQSPQIASLIESGVRAYINRKTVALKFSGGNYILAPTNGLFDTITLTNGTETLRVVGKQTAQRVIERDPGFTQVNGNTNLDWKLAINKLNPSISIYDTDEWKAFSVHSEAKGDKKVWYELRSALQKQLDSRDSNGELVWEVQPAEVMMPFAFKKEFNLVKGMQPSDVTVEYFERGFRAKEFIAKFTAMWEEMTYKAQEDFAIEMSQTSEGVSMGKVRKVIKLNKEGVEIGGISEALNIEEEMVFDVLDQFQQYMLTKRADFISSNVRSLAEQKYSSFQKSLEVIVGRIPSTGMQSMVVAKIIGFIESNKNSIWFPKELMMIQGADLDIDKAVVLSWWFDKDGILILDNSPKGLQNQITQLQYDIAKHPSNQIVSDSPVEMGDAKAEREKRNATNPDPFRARIQSLMSVYTQKVLASEGKAMVGVVMNLYKAYNLIYYTDLKTQRAGNFSEDSKTTVKPLVFFDGQEMVRKEEIANLDPSKAERQAWSFFSTLGNAATDNAKEMILGAIKANLQTGNIIGLMTSYGVEVSNIFDFLAQPVIQEVMFKVRNSSNIGNDLQIPTTIESGIAEVIREKGKGITDTEEKLLASLLSLSKSADELQILASTLGINREIPVSAYDRFAFQQKLENYVNEALEKETEKRNKLSGRKDNSLVFRLDKFILDPSYANEMVSAYGTIINSFNILKVINTVPDIKKYLESMVYLNTVTKSLTDKYASTENIISEFKQEFPENKFQNIKEEEYKGVVRFLEEYTIAKYVQESGVFDDFNVYQDGKKIALDIKELSDIAKFQQMFPEFLYELQEDNQNRVFNNNKFFSSLQPMINAKGKYTIIPNIQDMSATEQFELQAALNGFNLDVSYKGMLIPNTEFKRMLFLYSVVNSKGKVSTTSFFELFNPEYKNQFEYTRFLKNNPNIASQVNQGVTTISHLASTLTSLLPVGASEFSDSSYTDQYGSTKKVEKTAYKAVVKEKELLPPYVKSRFKGQLYTYKLTELIGTSGVQETVYSIIKSIYRPITLSVSSKLDQLAHITNSHIYKTINDSRKVLEMTEMENESVPLVIKTKEKVDRDLRVYTQIGPYMYNPSKELVSNIKCSK